MKVALPAPFPYFGIEVRADGTIWRTVSHGRPCEPRRIDNPDRSKGYLNVRLPRDGRWRTYKAHRLVWEWYHGPIPPGQQVNHRNLDKSDNRIENLELVTQRWRGRPRITDETKAAMREARSAGSTLTEIAARFGCSVTHAHRIVGRKEV